MSMTIQGIYACIAVRHMDAAVQWYATLLGRAPDDRPMPQMAQWRNMGTAGIQLWDEPEHAGTSRITIVVPVMAVERQRLEQAGLSLGPDVSGGFGLIVQVVDPDGNRITLAEPPKGFPGTT